MNLHKKLLPGIIAVAAVLICLFMLPNGAKANDDPGQHVKLVHNATENDHAFIGYCLGEDSSDFVYERGKIAAKDLTFEAKVTAGTKMRIEFYVRWDLFKSDGTTEIVSRRLWMDIQNGVIVNALDGKEVGTIPADVDMTEWNTYTVRVSRQTGYSGTYDIQLLVNGENYITEACTMSTQGGTPAERFAIHARTPGAVEIDNLKFEELYLDGPKGTVTADSVNTVWESGFGAWGTELTYATNDEGYVPGKWVKNERTGTEVVMVSDRDVDTDTETDTDTGTDIESDLTFALNTDGESYSVTDCSTDAFGKLVIPATYNGKPVTSIGNYAFSGCTELTSVTIPNSVTTVGHRAFNGCTGLTSVTVPNSVASVGNYVFSGCAGLTSVAIPNSITTISQGMFNSCTGLTSITIPNSVTTIEEWAFDGCTGLTSVTIPNSVTSIGSHAFYDCTRLQYSVYNGAKYLGNDSNPYLFLYGTTSSNITTCTIHEDTKFIGRAFEDCTKLTSVTIPNGVISIGYAAFNGTGLTNITIPNSVKFIDEWAFGGCAGLTSIAIPNSVTTIGRCAFADCSGLTSITIPNSVTTIDECAFADCTGLTSVTIPNGVITIGWGAFSGCTRLTSITIPNSVITIGHGAFSGCTGLTSITIPNSVTTIDEWAFEDCTGLTSVTIPNSVTTIGRGAFKNCTGLTSVTIPNSITSIDSLAFTGCAKLQYSVYDSGKYLGNDSNPYLFLCGTTSSNITTCTIHEDTKFIGRAFEDCTKLTSITIPDSVTSIGNDAFWGCTSLTSITIPNSVTSIGDYVFSRCASLASITIPDSVTSIGDYTFSNCTSLTSITIPRSVTSIGNYAFWRCGGLTSITIPDSVTSIGNCAFEDCTGLTSVAIPDSVTSIGGEAFSGCTSLTNVTIPGNVTSIGNHAFYNCTGLTSVTIPDGVTTIEDGAFQNCTGLTSITIPNSVTSIGGEAFSNCSSLTSITIPDSVTSIGNYAFYYCTGLTSITIPDSVTSIGEWAFADCFGLTSITIPDSVTNLGDGAFNGCTIEELIIADGSKTVTLSMVVCESTLKTVVIPDSVTSINGYAFNGCYGLTFNFYDNAKYLGNSENPYLYLHEAVSTSITSCTIHPNARFIGAKAFKDCADLTSITIPDSVTSIGEEAFAECSSLKSVTFGDGLTKIESDAFFGCLYLNKVVFGNKIPQINDGAFACCYEITEVHVPDIQTWLLADIDAERDYFSDGDVNLYIDGQIVTAVVIPDGITSIPPWALNYGGIKSVYMPSSITTIGECAFSYHGNLETIFYGGTAAQKEEISMDFFDDSLLDATWHYNVRESTFAGQDCYYCPDCMNYYLPDGSYALATVVFKDWDGTVISSGQYHFLQDVVVPASPTRESDSEDYDYVFIKWSDGVGPCIGNAEYVAQYEKQTMDGFRYTINEGKVTITAYSGEGGVVMIPKTIEGYPVTTIGACAFEHRGDIKVVHMPATVTRIEIYAFSYECMPIMFFEGTAEQEDAMYIATFNSFSGWHNEVREAVFADQDCYYCPECDEYLFADGQRVPATITLLDYDGTVYDTVTVYYKDTAMTMWSMANSVTDPTRPSDDYYHYEFYRWEGSLAEYCMGNYSLTAGYTRTERTYSVQFKDTDGSVISTKSYKYGAAVTVPADPTKAADNTYTYAFAGWDKEVSTTCVGAATYTATYDATYIDYTVVFKNWDGTVISSKTYHYGDAVVAPTNPVRAADNTYTYAFAGWNNDVVPCEGDATYTATFARTYIEYTVVFKDWDGTVISSKTYYWGSYVDAPSAPGREADNTYTYNFADWGSDFSATCNGNRTYTATYTAEYIRYAVTFVDWNGVVLSSANYHYGDTIVQPAAPTRPSDERYAYAFAGWDTPVTICTGSAGYSATYTQTPIEYTVVFKDADGTVISEETYNWGDSIVIPADPNKEADNTYTYAFSGWSPAVSSTCKGNATYTAAYTSTYIQYTITFQFEDGTVISRVTRHYGQAVSAPGKVTAPDGYKFVGWDKEIVPCAGNATYTAVCTVIQQEYVVVFKDWDGREISRATYHYGDTVVVPADPTRPNDSEYSYTFTGWNKTVTICTGNATYTATYSSKSLVPDDVTSDEYTISGGVISKIEIGTKVSALIGNLNESEYVKIFKGTTEVSGDALIGTGMVVKIMDGDTVVTSVTVVVTGDTNGDGKLTVTDFVQMQAHLLNKTPLQGAAAKAADTSGDGKTTVTDYVQIQAHILGKSAVQPRSITVAASTSTSASTSQNADPVPEPVVTSVRYAPINAIVPNKRTLMTV